MSPSEPVTTLTMNPAVDRSFTIESMAPDRKIRARDSIDSAGGGGINVARALHELGCAVTAVWACGGTMGEHLRRLLDAEGVVHRAVPLRGMTRENLIVFESSRDRQYRFGFPGPRLSEDEVDACRDAFRGPLGPGVAVLSGSLPLGVDDGFYAAAVREIPAGCRVVLDSSGEALAQGIDEGVFLVKPNVRELGSLAGRRLEGIAGIEKAARDIVASGGAEHVVVSLGSQGGLLVDSDGSAYVPSPPVETASVVGAGDSMVAGLVAGIVRGYAMRDSLRLGVAAGAAAVTCAATGLCRRADVDSLFERSRLADLAREDLAGG